MIFKNTFSVIFLIFIFISVSCSQQDVDFEILPEEKMREILVDIHIYEAMAEAIGKGHPDSVRNEILLSYEHIFEKHGVDKNLFFKNFDYYVFNKLDELDELYQYIIEDLNILEAEISIKKSSGEKENDKKSGEEEN